jgi:hypothetical protein
MAQEITQEIFSGTEPIQGSLTGNFQDALDYLDWSINVFAGKGNMDTTIKGNAFADAVQTLNTRFGMQISTYYLKQFCQAQKHKNLHIAYMLRLADMRTNPTKTSFKGGIANGRRCIVPKIFDMVISKQEFEDKENQITKFKEQSMAEFEAKRLALEQQKLNVQKLQIIGNLGNEDVSPTELEEFAPDLMVKDRTLN